MTNQVTFAAYKAAADRIRSGRGTPEDEATCDAYDAQERVRPATAGPAPRSIYDLPVARALFEADRRDRR